MHNTRLKVDTFFVQEGGGEPPHGSLGWAIDQHFGSMEKLIAKMNAEGAAVQGSGWVVCYINLYTLCIVHSFLICSLTLVYDIFSVACSGQGAEKACG